MMQSIYNWIGTVAAGICLCVLGLVLLYLVVRLSSAAIFRSLDEFLNRHTRKGPDHEDTK
jgi:hypothetical protein